MGERWREPFKVTIDYDQLIWQALQMVNTSFESPEFVMAEQHTKFGGTTSSKSRISLERYEDNVLNLYNYILPEWVEQDNKKFPKRFAEWAAEFKQYQGMKAAWEKGHKDWEASSRDPLTEPIEPVSPGGRPKPFLAEVEDCKVDSVWKPFNLHRAIIHFLHRREFFKRKTDLEVIEGTEEQDQEAVTEGQPGSPTTAESDGERSKSLSPL